MNGRKVRDSGENAVELMGTSDGVADGSCLNGRKSDVDSARPNLIESTSVGDAADRMIPRSPHGPLWSTVLAIHVVSSSKDAVGRLRSIADQHELNRSVYETYDDGQRSAASVMAAKGQQPVCDRHGDCLPLKKDRKR